MRPPSTAWAAAGALLAGMSIGWLAARSSQDSWPALAEAHETTAEANATGRVFEMRTYSTRPGLLENLHERFRNHTNHLFVKHGMSLIGYWTPTDKEDTLVYLLAYPSREAREVAWGAFRSDPGWQKAFKESHEEAGGRLLKKDGVVSQFLRATDYSPMH